LHTSLLQMHIYKMEISNLIPHIEALIFASDKPLTAAEITDLVNQAFGFMEDKIEVEQVDASLEGIVEKYNSEFYPFEVRQSGGGWQFLTKKDFHKTVAQLNGEKFLKRLSSAALETLAIVAYKQPVTKGEIEAIRGVSSDYAVQKLLEKELIVITGRNEKLPGHPLVYATSKNFMDYFGINSPEDLPKIKEVLADQVVQPTIVHHTDFETSENLIVTEDGELIIPALEQEGESEEEGNINGHTFSQESEDINQESDQPTEDIPTEEAIEEYIADEVFIEGDEEEIEEIVEEEVASEEPVGDSAASDVDEAAEEESNPEEDLSEDNEEEEKI
jgi:segregation and condensation protein B